MSFADKLTGSSLKNDSLVCVGLDPVAEQMPAGIDIFGFNKSIIDATADIVCAYKPNSAFYEAYGTEGIEILTETCKYIRQHTDGIPIILDYKRADIGNTNKGYLAFAFDTVGVDAVTVNPYMGFESLQPFLSRSDKGIIILCRTSNPGAGEFQDLVLEDGSKLYEQVAANIHRDWNVNGNCSLVVGATVPDELAKVRTIVGDDMWLLSTLR